MKKILAWMLVVALTAAIAVGGTLAYLTDTDEDVNVMTLGNVKIDQLEYERVDVETKDENAVVQEFHDNKPLYPAVIKDGFNWETDSTVDWSQIGKDGYSSGIWDSDKINNEQDKMVFVKNKGSYDAYVRSIFAFEANGYTLDQFKALFHLNINETDWTWKWEENPVSIPGAEGDQTTNYIIATATYNKALKPGELTEISLSQIALDPSAGNADIEGFGETYQILVKTQAIQADGFNNPVAALNDGFGEVTASTVPWTSDSPILGIDLRTALHYYEGDTTNMITSKVSKITFGVKKEYPEIVDGYTGTLVDVEQDVDVYAYYVPNDSNYDIYFLANEPIYAPKDSSKLFADMTSLSTIDTHNFDVSRTESMRRMFYNCKNMTEIDVSHFDTSNVTTMNGMFFLCNQIRNLDVSKWDTRNVTNMYAMFYSCKMLEQIDVSDWQVGNVTNMEFTFSGCNKFKTLDVADWDVSNVTSFDAFFQSATKTYKDMMLESIDVSKWDISSCTNLNRMFYGCGKLQTLDMSSWNTENVTDVTSMFFNCKELTTLYASEKWNTDRIVNPDGMFSGCSNLVGGNGTQYANTNVTNASYARIDTAETPGYLTYKAATNE